MASKWPPHTGHREYAADHAGMRRTCETVDAWRLTRDGPAQIALVIEWACVQRTHDADGGLTMTTADGNYGGLL